MRVCSHCLSNEAVTECNICGSELCEKCIRAEQKCPICQTPFDDEDLSRLSISRFIIQQTTLCTQCHKEADDIECPNCGQTYCENCAIANQFICPACGYEFDEDAIDTDEYF